MEELLRYDHVDISYNGIPAVQDLSFTLRPGEILGIVGESGCGKSTLLKAAMGLLGSSGMVTRGDIWYKGRNLPDLPARALRKLNGPELGMIFQSAGSSFCPIRTVGAQFYEIMTQHGSATKKEFENCALELLEKLGFEDGRRILRSYPFELSGGMQQRVGIAAAMLLRPGVLFADEPTAALDVSVQKQVLEELLLLRKTYGTAIVLVAHNIGVIGAMADRVLVMKEKDALYEKPDFSEEDGMRASELEAEFADMDGWEAESDASKLLQGLGIPVELHYDLMANTDPRLKVNVLLAQALFGKPDIVMLRSSANL